MEYRIPNPYQYSGQSMRQTCRLLYLSHNLITITAKWIEIWQYSRNRPNQGILVEGTRNTLGMHQEYTRNAPGIYQECTRNAPECTRNSGRKYQECTRNAPGILVGRYQECTRNPSMGPELPGILQEYVGQWKVLHFTTTSTVYHLQIPPFYCFIAISFSKKHPSLHHKWETASELSLNPIIYRYLIFIYFALHSGLIQWYNMNFRHKYWQINWSV